MKKELYKSIKLNCFENNIYFHSYHRNILALKGAFINIYNYDNVFKMQWFKIDKLYKCTKIYFIVYVCLRTLRYKVLDCKKTTSNVYHAFS